MIFTKKCKNFLRLNGLKLGLTSGILLHCGYCQRDRILALSSEFSIAFLEIELSCFWVAFLFTEIGNVTVCFRILNFLKEDSVAWKLEAINNFRWCHVRSILKVVGRVSVTQLTSMASQCGPKRCFKGFATFAADGQRKREERRDREKRRKENYEGMQPRMYDCSFFDRGARRNGRTLQQKLKNKKNTTDSKG